MDELLTFRKNAIQGALTQPLCSDYRMEWIACESDKEKLIKLAIRQQSCPFVAHYCYSGMGVSKEYIAANFSKYINGYTINNADNVDGYTYGLYVDYNYDNPIEVDKDVIHIMWSENSVLIPKTKCPVIYVSNKSKIRIIGDGYNSVRVYLFDESKVIIDDIDYNSVVTVYKYSDKCKVKRGKFCFGSVKEFRKELRL